MDIGCVRCSFEGVVARAEPGSCPQCGAALCRRVKPAPTPWTHGKQVWQAVVSPGGLVVVVLVAFFTGQGFLGYVQRFGSLILFLTAVRLAWSAVNHTKRVEFPSLDPQAMMSGGSMFPVFVHSILFGMVPVALLMFAATPIPRAEPFPADVLVEEEREEAEDPAAGDEARTEESEDPEAPAITEVERAAMRQAVEDSRRLVRAMEPNAQEKVERSTWEAAQKAERKQARTHRVVAAVVALLLLAYAVMALVLFLVSNTTWGMFAVGTGLQLIRRDPGGYVGLTLLVAALNGLAGLASLPFFEKHFLGAVLMAAVRSVATLMVYGLCGLFVRKHARVLGLQVDADEWEPMAHPVTPFVPDAPATPRRVVPLDLDPEDPPLAVGSIVEAPSAAPAPAPPPSAPKPAPPAPGMAVSMSVAPPPGPVVLPAQVTPWWQLPAAGPGVQGSAPPPPAPNALWGAGPAAPARPGVPWTAPAAPEREEAKTDDMSLPHEEPTRVVGPPR